MTTTAETVEPGAASLARGAALAIAVVVVELLWATYAADIERRVALDVPTWPQHATEVGWGLLSVPFLVLAAAVSVGARSARRRSVALGLCAVGITVTIGTYELIATMFTHATPSVAALRTVDYATVMLVSVQATLAWCVSRRAGASWVVSTVLVAAAAAAIMLRLQWHGLTEIVPVVLACLVGWAIETRSG